MTESQKSKPRDTKARILDTAESLFAQYGFKRTSISQLARRAGVNQAAVNYHFGSKAALVETVIDRRLEPIDRERMQALEAIRDQWREHDRVPGVADLLRAYIGPAFRLTAHGEGGRSFLLIASRAMVEPDNRVRDLFIHRFEPAFRLLFALLKKRLDPVSGSELMWRLHFAIGALSHAMRVFANPQTPPMAIFPTAADAGAVVDQLIPFLTAGVTAEPTLTS